LWPGTGLALGICLGRIFPEVPSFFLFAGILLLLPSLWFLRGKKLFVPVFILILMAGGMLRIHQARRIPVNDISVFADGRWGSLEGRVISLPEKKEKGKRQIHSFVLEAENLVRGRDFFETGGKVQVFLFNPSEAPPFGSRVRLRGKLKVAKGPQNPGEFDYIRYLSEQGIRAVWEGFGKNSFVLIKDPSDSKFHPSRFLQTMRERGSARFDSLFPSPLNVLLKALIFGMRRGLTETLRDDFMKTGTSHLLPAQYR
jgi:competence protein ComEC